jgi:hypothetical protein
MTQESRYATFAWFAIWILGWFTYRLMDTVQAFGGDFPDGRIVSAPSTGEGDALGAQLGWWSYLSLYHTLGRVQTWVFGFGEFRDVVTAAVVLTVLTSVSLTILVRRVAAPMRV